MTTQPSQTLVSDEEICRLYSSLVNLFVDDSKPFTELLPEEYQVVRDWLAPILAAERERCLKAIDESEGDIDLAIINIASLR